MADQKISQLAPKTTIADADDLVIVDTSTGLTKKITGANAKTSFTKDFSVLTDVSGAYTTALALYRTNAAVTGLEETTVLVAEPAANQFSIARGTSLVQVEADLRVTADSFINQDVRSSATPTWAGANFTDNVEIAKETALTNTVSTQFRLKHTTTGTPAVGIGVGMDFEIETAPGNNEVMGTFDCYADFVVSDFEDGVFVWRLMSAGTMSGDLMKLEANGRLTVSGLTDQGSIDDIVYTNNVGQLTGLQLAAQDQPLLSNGSNVAPKFGTMRLAPAPQSAAGATPVDSDVSALNDDTFGSIVGTGGRVFFFWKNATDVYYVEATAL